MRDAICGSSDTRDETGKVHGAVGQAISRSLCQKHISGCDQVMKTVRWPE